MESKIFVEVSNNQILHNVSFEERKLIEKSLTYENPKYASAMKFSRYKYIKIPKELKFYKHIDDKILEVPRGFNLKKCLNEYNTDCVGYHFEPSIHKKVVYPKFRLELRGAQKEASKKYEEEHQRELFYPRSIVQLPTGKGKSILAIYLASKLQLKTLVLVHKTDLLVGWTKDIKLCFGENIDVGIIQSKKRHISDFITIAMVQTINNMSTKEKEELFNSFDFVVQDEVHHLNPDMFGIIDKFKCKHKLGLSATPTRSDGMDYLFDLFLGGLVYQYEYLEEDEDICGAEVITTKTNYKYRPFLHKGLVFNYYDFSREELPEEFTFVDEIDYKKRPKIPYQVVDSARVNSPKYKQIVCKQILNEYKQGHSILALFSLKEDVRKYYNFLSNFIPKDKILLFYGDSKEKVDTMLEKAESKECLLTLATYSKAKEGTNVKSWEVLFLVSSINDAKNTEQAVGRIRRKKEDKLQKVRIYDYPADDVYTMKKHFYTRLAVYKKLKFSGEMLKEKRGLFSRGYF